MNVTIISDSFKGTISSERITELFEKTYKRYFPDGKLNKFVIADGGEGTIDAIASFMNGKKVHVSVSDPYFHKMDASYLLLNDTAVIELASCAGLPLVKENKNPSLTTTFGVGELMKHAISKNGAKEIILALGGSATNDGACGAACALGTKFFDRNGTEFIPVGATLKNIDKIDSSFTESLLKNIRVTCMCDVKNEMYGMNGASYIYARQKGADDSMVKCLDDGLKHLSDIFIKSFNKDVHLTEGSGAAGAFGAGAIAFFNASLKSGIHTLLEMTHFNDAVRNADYIVSGEGKLDEQSLYGKVLSGILDYRNKYNKNAKLILIAGMNDLKEETLAQNGISKVYTLVDDKSLSFDIIKRDAETNYTASLEKFFKDIINGEI